MELIILKKGFFLAGKAHEIVKFLREKSKIYTTVKEMINSELH
jgi:hypothetical protein